MTIGGIQFIITKT